MTDDERRTLWKKYSAECRRFYALQDCSELAACTHTPEFPEILRGLTCGARTRKGTPCKRTDLYRNGRCKLHGGRSTGPKTEEGKKKSAQNLPSIPVKI